MNRIVIFMSGGLVQEVVCQDPVEVFVVDYDTEGVDQDHPPLTKLSGGDCMLYPIVPSIDSHTTHVIAKTWQIA